MEKMIKTKMLKEELAFKQAWVNQLIDAVTMEVAESWLKIEQLKDEDKQDSASMNTIHDYQEEYKDKVKEDRDIAQQRYAEYEEVTGLQPWQKTLLFISLSGLAVLLYFMRRKKMYCFKVKINPDDMDQQHPLI